MQIDFIEGIDHHICKPSKITTEGRYKTYWYTLSGFCDVIKHIFLPEKYYWDDSHQYELVLSASKALLLDCPCPWQSRYIPIFMDSNDQHVDFEIYRSFYSRIGLNITVGIDDRNKEEDMNLLIVGERYGGETRKQKRNSADNDKYEVYVRDRLKIQRMVRVIQGISIFCEVFSRCSDCHKHQWREWTDLNDCLTEIKYEPCRPFLPL